MSEQDQWYFGSGGQQAGPVSLDELRGRARRGELAANAFVWREGMSEWQPAAGVSELAGAFATAAPVVAQPVTVSYYGGGDPIAERFAYASFWARVGAYVLDYIVTYIAGAAVGFVIGFSLAIALGAQRAGPIVEAVASVAGLVLTWLYFALMESSAKQATLGKMALGVRVVGADGERISFGRATGRYFAKILSGLILGIGFLMVAFTDRKQGLHDQIATTFVVRNPPLEPTMA